jgi:hypothetical protein
MTITIAERLHPFSHRPGTKFLLPKSSFAVQIFPTRLECIDLAYELSSFAIDFHVNGPIKGFTAELDLESGLIRVFGQTPEGYVRYLLQCEREGLWLTVERAPNEKLACRHSFSEQTFLLSPKEKLLIPFSAKIAHPVSEERLSLGMHKSQEWEGIHRRLDCKEIFPLWHRLSQWIVTLEISAREGNYALLEACRHKLEHRERTTLLEAFESFFLAAFEGVLTPRLFDNEYQGILPGTHALKSSVSPLPLLTEGGKLIRALFFQERANEIEILPCLPSSFHCGRMTGIQTSQGHRIDFEWTKKALRRLRIHVFADGKLCLKLPKKTSCRLKKGRKTIKHSPIDAEGKLSLELQANEILHLDRFH